MNSFEESLIIGALLIILSVVASKASSRWGFPVLVLFLGLGMLSGAHRFGGLMFADYELAQRLGVFALIFILFSGGMATQVKEVRPVLGPALILSTLGVVLATFLVGVFSRLCLGFTILEGCLLGATVASTDVAAVFTVLRSKNIHLKDGIAPLLELESALNDPMAVFLGVALLSMAHQNHQSWIGSWFGPWFGPWLGLIPLFFLQMILGVLMGWGSGKLGKLIMNHINLEFDGLYPVLSIGWILLTYGLTQALGGSGYLAVYLGGIVLGNENLLQKRSLIHFHEGIAWLGQIVMFLAMGLLVNPSDLLKIAPLGLALSAFLIFVARPVSVFLCFPMSRFSAQEKLMVSWAGLRGAVPISLAGTILVSDIPRATDIFNLVFFVTFLSVLFQGTTIPSVAKWLKVEL